MNKRIKEIAEQVSKEIMRNTPSFLVTNEMWKEKFAELIVQECAGIVEDAVDHREPASTYAQKIKQHFGVEE